MATVAAVSPPSQFSALLRRSKFASYDATIAQVYTAYDGYAHRGDFGFKRPLPLRRRNAHVTVRSMDSRHQETVWKSAEKQNRWIRMWQEVGVTPVTKLRGYWGQRLGPPGEYQWIVDSEFVRRDAEGSTTAGAANTPAPPSESAVSNAYPNIFAMSEQEFANYLEELRKLRPQFEKFLEETAAKHPNKKTIPSAWFQSHHPGDLHLHFIRAQAAAEHSAETSTKIEGAPQKSAGLSYTRSPPLQSLLINKPQKARILHEVNTRAGKGYFVEFAGTVTLVDKKQFLQSKLTPWAEMLDITVQEQQPVEDEGEGEGEGEGEEAVAEDEAEVLKDGVVNVRMFDVKLQSVPRTVGTKSNGLEGTRLDLQVYADVEDLKGNPYPPGSPEYVGHLEAVTSRSTLAPPKLPRKKKAPKTKLDAVASQLLVKQLESMVGFIAPQRDTEQ